MADRAVGSLWARLMLATAIVAAAVAPPRPAGAASPGARVRSSSRPGVDGRSSVAASPAADPSPAKDKSLPAEADEDPAASSPPVAAPWDLAPGPSGPPAVARPSPAPSPPTRPLRC